MKLQNFGEEFEMTYDGRDVKIPNGIFEVSDTTLGYFIQGTSSKWGKNVKIIDDGKSAEIKQDVVKEEIKKEESKEEIDDVIKEAKEIIKKGKKASK